MMQIILTLVIISLLHSSIGRAVTSQIPLKVVDIHVYIVSIIASLRQ